MESSVEGSLEVVSVMAAHYRERQWPRRFSYRLEGQLHERRVVNLSDLILCPVKARSCCIDSFL